MTDKKVVLYVNGYPGFLMPAGRETLTRIYGDVTGARIRITSRAQLEAQAASAQVVAVVARSEDLHLLEGILRLELAECWQLVGTGDERRLERIHSLHEVSHGG